MIKLDMPVIVEGKYDKIALENVIDALIITTDGFGIFKNKDKQRLLRSLSKKCGGVIVLTDSDSGGLVIRSALKRFLGDCGEIINVYVPEIKGKERRKAKAGAEGLLGVEGMSPELLEKALLKSNVKISKSEKESRKITKTDMFDFGLSGKNGSADERKKLSSYLELPQNLTSNALLDLLNTFFTYEEFCEAVKKCQEKETKS